MGIGHLLRILGGLFLHTYEPCLYLAHGGRIYPHFYWSRIIFATPLVDVCGCGRLCYRKEWHQLYGADLLFRNHGAEARWCYLR